MNREETKELIKVMQHYVDGGDVESRLDCFVYWSDDASPCWHTNYNWCIALSPEDRLIMDAWEDDHECIEVLLFNTWGDRQQPSELLDAKLLKVNRYRIKPKYTPEQQALIDAHERGESIDCRRLDAEEGEEWVTFVPKPSWIFSTYEYRLTPAPVVIVTHRNHHGDIQYTIKNSKAADSYDGWDNWSVIEERTI